MQLEAKGILIDHTSKVLLAQPAAAQGLVIPGAPLEAGVLPDTSLASAFRDGTGLVVLPVRLTSLAFNRQDKIDTLSLYFRCIMRGGNLEAAAPYAQAGFFDPQPLPRALSISERVQIEGALRHPGGVPYWSRSPRNAASVLLGLFERQQDTPGGSEWTAHARLVARDAAGSVLMTTGDGPSAGRLPDMPVAPGDAPWETADHLLSRLGGGKLTGLPGVYLATGSPSITFLFAAALGAGSRPSAYRLVGVEEAAAAGLSVPLGDAADPDQPTHFRLLD